MKRSTTITAVLPEIKAKAKTTITTTLRIINTKIGA